MTGDHDGVGTVKRYYQEEELAEGFNVSRRTIARWRQLGAIGYLRLPGGQKLLYLARHVWDFQKRTERPRKLVPVLIGSLLQLLEAL
jgi:hypothetical protein